MKHFVIYFRTLVLLVLALAVNVQAQTRSVGMGALIVDDNAGHKMSVTAPQPGDPAYNAWIAAGTLSWRLPIPPSNNAPMAFVMTGSNNGQVLVWNPPNSSGGSGGAEGVWQTGLVNPANISLSAGQFLMGNGSNLGSAVTLSGDLSVGNTGIVTLANTAGARSDLGLGTIATQNANNVSLTGGSISGTAIGSPTASTGTFTTVTSPTVTSNGAMNIGPATNSGGTGVTTTLSAGASSNNGSNGGDLTIFGGAPGTGGNYGNVNINTNGGNVNI